ncbi:uncharacterized protein BDW70DRAFT_152090 [Aspergillus foveolatus]|uniref:uncharacterized protein n=1 Tax=Aspergillus foveolatus TaxID=210207 RepID=UPI003CCE185D
METDGAGPPSPRVGAGDRDRGLNYYDSQPGLDTPSGTFALADAGLTTPAVPVPEKHGGNASDAESNGSLLPPQPLLLCNSREKTKLPATGGGSWLDAVAALPNSFPSPRTCSNGPAAMQYSAVLLLAFDLDSLCRELRLVMQAERPSLTALVEMQLRHAMLALLQPFVLPARTDAQFYLARQMCLQCAMALAAYAHESQPPASVGAEPSLAGSSLLLQQMQMTARGYLRGAFHPAVICALAIEIIVQLSDEAGGAMSGRPPYSLDSMARAQRAPIIKTLERLNSQLREMMNLAFPALKRYIPYEQGVQDEGD